MLLNSVTGHCILSRHSRLGKEERILGTGQNQGKLIANDNEYINIFLLPVFKNNI